MVTFLLLRLEAPLMSFGSPAVDHTRPIQEFPTLSMLTGLLANALGLDRRNFDALESLQARIRYGACREIAGTRIRDYMTVGLDQDFLQDTGWTTFGRVEKRAGGEASKGTHIRHVEFFADAVYTVAVTLEPPEEWPAIQDLARAVQYPCRPLFIGRKCCLPAAPMFFDLVVAEDVVEALTKAPSSPRSEKEQQQLEAWWSTDTSDLSDPVRVFPVFDRRDWRNQVHTGRRFMMRQTIHREAIK